MNDAEIRDAFNQLAEMLRGLGLDWVVEQVQEAIRAGHTTPREEPIQESLSRRKLKVSADSLTSLPFTAEQELQLLAVAIRHAVVDAGRMEQAVVTEFAAEAEVAGVANADIVFVSDRPDIPDTVVASARDLTADRLAAIEALPGLLDALLAEAARAD